MRSSSSSFKRTNLDSDQAGSQEGGEEVCVVDQKLLARQQIPKRARCILLMFELSLFPTSKNKLSYYYVFFWSYLVERENDVSISIQPLHELILPAFLATRDITRDTKRSIFLTRLLTHPIDPRTDNSQPPNVLTN